MYDIAIVGLGPAGATLARTLTGRYKVLALDRRDLSASLDEPASRKCCGGLLATDAQKALAKFGLTLPRDVLVDPQIFAVRTIDLHRRQERYYQRFYVNLDRARFDAWLRSLIPDAATVADRALCKGVRRVRGGYALRVRRDGKTAEYGARVVVGADGGGSRIRAQFYPDHPIRRYVAIQEWFAQDGATEPFYAAVFDPDITDCYCWTLHKNGVLLVGAALPERDADKRFQLLKHRLQRRGYRFGEKLRREGCVVHRPTGLSSFVTGKNGVCLVGEAAGFISPSSLEGISYAMDSAYLLGNELNQAADKSGEELARACRRYAADTLPMRLRLAGKLLKQPFLYEPLLRGAVMASGLDSIRIV